MATHQQTSRKSSNSFAPQRNSVSMFQRQLFPPASDNQLTSQEETTAFQSPSSSQLSKSPSILERMLSEESEGIPAIAPSLNHQSSETEPVEQQLISNPLSQRRLDMEPQGKPKRFEAERSIDPQLISNPLLRRRLHGENTQAQPISLETKTTRPKQNNNQKNSTQQTLAIRDTPTTEQEDNNEFAFLPTSTPVEDRLEDESTEVATSLSESSARPVVSDQLTASENSMSETETATESDDESESVMEVAEAAPVVEQGDGSAPQQSAPDSGNAEAEVADSLPTVEQNNQASAETTITENAEAQPETPELAALSAVVNEMGGESTGGESSEETQGDASQSSGEQESASGEAAGAAQALQQTSAEAAQLGSQGIEFSVAEPIVEANTADGISSVGMGHEEQTQPDAAQLEQQRIEASAIASNFMGRASEQIQQLTTSAEMIASRIEVAAGIARNAVLNAVAQQQALVQSQIAQQQAVAQGQAQAAIAQIDAQHSATVSTITQSTATTREAIEAEYSQAVTAVETKETTQLAELITLYDQMKQDYKGAGETVGGEAKALGDQRADAYQSKVRSPKVDDSLLDGPVTDNRNEARAKAAREVGKQYEQGLIDKAAEFADEAQNGLSLDQASVAQLTAQSQATLDVQRQQNLASLESAEASAIAQADQAKASLLSTVDQTLNAAIQSLGQQQTAQAQLIAGYGQKQIAAIDTDAQKAIAALEDGNNQAANQLKTALQQFQAQTQGQAAPDPTALATVVSELQQQFDQAIATTQAQTEQGIASSAQGILNGGQQAAGAVIQLGQGAVQEAITVGQGLQTSLTGLITGATNTFQQIQGSYTTTLEGISTTAKEGFAQVTEEVQTAFDTLNQAIEQQTTDSVPLLEDGLRGSFTDLEATIDEEAQKAADQVKPRWKKALKIFLIIAVIVVVALVVGPAVIGAVGAAAGALGAGAATASAVGAVVGGAIVGAASGAVIQMGSNLIDGNHIMEGVGKAMVVGAIGGALGGAGGFLGNALGNAGKLGAGMTQSISKFGIDVVFDIAGGLVGDLSVGNPITIEGVLIGAAIGAAVSISVTGLGNRLKPLQDIQTRSFNKGAQFGRAQGISIADRTGIPIAGQRKSSASLNPDYDPRGLKSTDLEARAQAGDQSALDELNYRELVYQRHRQVKNNQPIHHDHPQMNIKERGLGDLPTPTRDTVEASRQVTSYLETTLGIPSKRKSFAVNISEVKGSNGEPGFIVSLSGSQKKVDPLLEKLQNIAQDLDGDFELGPSSITREGYDYDYDSNMPENFNFKGGRDCAEPKSYFQAGDRTIEGTTTIWFGKRDTMHHEMYGLHESDPKYLFTNPSHGMYMLPCPTCENNSGGMIDRSRFLPKE